MVELIFPVVNFISDLNILVIWIDKKYVIYK